MCKNKNNKLIKNNTRMSIDVHETEHKKIKMRAAKEGVSIRKFIIDCIQSKMVPENTKNPKDVK